MLHGPENDQKIYDDAFMSYSEEIRSPDCDKAIVQNFEEKLVENLAFWDACSKIRQGNIEEGTKALEAVFEEITEEIAILKAVNSRRISFEEWFLN